MAKIENSHWTFQISQNQSYISYQFSMKIIISSCIICAKLCLCVICTNGPRVKNQEVTAYVWHYFYKSPLSSFSCWRNKLLIVAAYFRLELFDVYRVFFGLGCSGPVFKGYLRCKTIFCNKMAFNYKCNSHYFLCFHLKISKFLCFCKIHKFQYIWLYEHCYITDVTLMLISLEFYVLSKWNLVKY